MAEAEKYVELLKKHLHDLSQIEKSLENSRQSLWKIVEQSKQVASDIVKRRQAAEELARLQKEALTLLSELNAEVSRSASQIASLTEFPDELSFVNEVTEAIQTHYDIYKKLTQESDRILHDTDLQRSESIGNDL